MDPAQAIAWSHEEINSSQWLPRYLLPNQVTQDDGIIVADL